MRKRTTAGLTLGLLAAMCGIGHGDEKSERIARQVQAYNDEEASAHAALASMMALAEEVPAFSKGDKALITPQMDAAAAAWASAAQLVSKGDWKGAEAMEKRARQLNEKRDEWSQRLRVRQLQAQIHEYLPANEDSFDALVEDRTEEDAKEIEAYMEAKKRRSELYGVLADAITPTADLQTVIHLQDNVYAADTEVHVAELKMQWAQQDYSDHRWIRKNRLISSPDLTDAETKIQEYREQIEQTYRQSREREHALEQQTREYTKLVDVRNDAYRAAKVASDAAKKSGN